MENTFIQLAIILGLSSILGFITVKLKLPLLIAYLVGGLLIATASLFDVHTSEALSFLPEVGIAFVLFLVGMELDLREVRKIGAPVLVAGLLQITITTIVGSVIARNFGFDVTESWYLGVGLSFSSTIVVIKLLLEKKDLTSLYGKLALGILILEDLVAVVILLGMTVSTSALHLGYQESVPLLGFVLKVTLLFSTALLLNRYLLPNIFKAVSKSGELLFLTSLAWCFIYVSFAILMGFSVVIGAFLAGVALASSPYHFQIQGKVKPLRDFFVALFFVYLGTQVNFSDLSKVYLIIFAFTGYTLLFKPMIFLLILGAFGFRKHTMFQTAISISQISEFSLIVILVAIKEGSATTAGLTVIALSAVLSMILSSLMISHSNTIYKSLKAMVSFFERKNFHHSLEDQKELEGLTNHVVVIGGHRVGGGIIQFLKKEHIPHIVLDFNPHHVEALLEEKIKAYYGDMRDPEVLDGLNLEEARMIISTAQATDDGLLLLEELKNRKINVPVILRGTTIEDAKLLYKKGADFVIIPEVIAGDLLTEKLKDHLDGGVYFKDRPRIELEKLSHRTLALEE